MYDRRRTLCTPRSRILRASMIFGRIDESRVSELRCDEMKMTQATSVPRQVSTPRRV